MGPGEAIWWKTNTEKSRGTVPLSDSSAVYTQNSSFFFKLIYIKCSFYLDTGQFYKINIQEKQVFLDILIAGPFGIF